MWVFSSEHGCKLRIEILRELEAAVLQKEMSANAEVADATPTLHADEDVVNSVDDQAVCREHLIGERVPRTVRLCRIPWRWEVEGYRRDSSETRASGTMIDERACVES
jgi:hypothetical protein